MHRSFYLQLAAVLVAFQAQAQQWEFSRSVLAFQDTFPTAHIALAMEGDVLAIARCTPAGSEVRLLSRDQGGADQWEPFAVLNDPRRGYGFSLDLDQGRLAIGIRGGITWDSEAGAVQVLLVDPSNLIAQVQDLGEFSGGNGLPGDRFGHSVLWQDDLLFVGATGRSHAKGSGAVYVFQLEDGALTERDMLQPDAVAFQLPRMIGFGANLVCDGQHLVIASPISGFQSDLRTGAIHVYSRDEAVASGWAPSATLFEVDLRAVVVDFQAYSYLSENDLGRDGLFLLDSTLFTHLAGQDSVPNVGYEVPDEHGYPMPPVEPACTRCSTSTYRSDGSGSWSLQASPSIPVAGAQRSVKGWYVTNDQAFVTSYDTTLWEWRTMSYTTPDHGTTWNATDTLPVLESCATYNGPVVATSDRFVRSALLQGEPCGLAGNERSIVLDVFRRSEAVGLHEARANGPYPLSISPVPATERCQVSFSRPGPWQVRIVSLAGAEVERVMQVAGRSAWLDLQDLRPGLYVVMAQQLNDGSRAIGRLVVD